MFKPRLDVCVAAVFGASLLAAGAATAAEFSAKQLEGGWQLVSTTNPNPTIRAFGPGGSRGRRGVGGRCGSGLTHDPATGSWGIG